MIYIKALKFICAENCAAEDPTVLAKTQCILIKIWQGLALYIGFKQLSAIIAIIRVKLNELVSISHL